MMFLKSSIDGSQLFNFLFCDGIDSTCDFVIETDAAYCNGNSSFNEDIPKPPKAGDEVTHVICKFPVKF